MLELFTTQPFLEEASPGSSLEVLREAIRVAGWERPDWREIDERLSVLWDSH
jgi:hypothetical protein